jgi:raffinose/stachyose/melibiose transport system permease protein
MRRRRLDTGGIAAQLILAGYSILVLYPVLLVVMNSFKQRRAIFNTPLALPTPQSFSLSGYATVLLRGDFPHYFVNSFVLTACSLAIILLFGAMAAHALVEFRFRGRGLLALYLALGMMLPIRLGTISLVSLIAGIGLTNSIAGLVIVYAAQGIPISTLILTDFLRQVPSDLKDAARIDGASEYGIFFRLVLPLARPAMGTVAMFAMIPIWNDLWFPLVLAPSESTRTVTLGAQQFLGEFSSDWNALLAALSTATLPIFALYLLFSRQMIRGVTAGAVK